MKLGDIMKEKYDKDAELLRLARERDDRDRLKYFKINEQKAVKYFAELAALISKNIREAHIFPKITLSANLLDWDRDSVFVKEFGFEPITSIKIIDAGHPLNHVWESFRNAMRLEDLHVHWVPRTAEDDTHYYELDIQVIYLK